MYDNKKVLYKERRQSLGIKYADSFNIAIPLDILSRIRLV